MSGARRKGGRRPIVLPETLKAKLLKDYYADELTVDELLKKYGISRYLLHKILKQEDDH